MDEFEMHTPSYSNYEVEIAPEYETYDYEGPQIHAGGVVISMLVLALFCAFNLVLIVVVAATKELRAIPGNWLLIALAGFLITEGVTSISNMAHYQLNMPHWNQTPGPVAGGAYAI